MEKKPPAEFMSEKEINPGTWKFVILFTIEDIFSLNTPVAIGVTYRMSSGAALRSLGHGIDLTWQEISWLLVIAVVLIVYIKRHAPSKINEFTLRQSMHSSTSYLSKTATEIVLGSFCSHFGEGFFSCSFENKWHYLEENKPPLQCLSLLPGSQSHFPSAQASEWGKSRGWWGSMLLLIMLTQREALAGASLKTIRKTKGPLAMVSLLWKMSCASKLLFFTGIPEKT